ncbi:MAG: hypothetical protein ACJ8CR_22045 [Roseiflexaceae bacterium]
MDGTHLRWRFLRWRAVLTLILLFVWVIPSVSAQNSPRYFAPSGHYLRGAFRSFWERNGGLPIFGYPITEEYVRRSDRRIVQFFERARFELTVRNNQAIIELAWLGVEYTGTQSFPRTPLLPSSGGVRYFPETGHTLHGAFLTFWSRRGADRIFGLPIGEEFQEQLTDGRWHTIQYFQRARFELWGSGVRLGLLGRALAPPQLLAPWPPNSRPAGPLNEDGTPRPPGPQPPPPHSAAALRVEPASGRPGQTFTVLGEGFDRDERVSLWITVPGGSVRPISQQPAADRNGSISGARIQIPTDSGFRDGVWYVTAHGLRSGRQGIGSFRLGGAPAPAPAPPSSPLGNLIHDSLRPRGNGAIVPLAAPSGFVFTFTAFGFDPNERIGAWLTRPDGKAEGLDGRLIGPDGRGGVRVTFGTQRLAEGVWTITAQGTSTGRMVTAPFKLTRDYVAPLGTPRPASRNGSVTPAEGSVRAAFQLTGAGFRASETLELWITSPGGIYYLAGTTRADSRGRIGYAPTQIVQLAAGSPTGVYGYHYRGTRSGVRVDLYFTFTG